MDQRIMGAILAGQGDAKIKRWKKNTEENQLFKGANMCPDNQKWVVVTAEQEFIIEAPNIRQALDEAEKKEKGEIIGIFIDLPEGG